jgi:uncharacterized cupredoxin-like copper-binding protein
VKLTDYGITMPRQLAGDAVLEVNNQGQEPHELALISLPTGVSMADALRELHEDHAQGNKPTSMPVAGGAAVVSPGQTAIVRLNLDAGRYLAVCYVPGPNGKPHFEHGMATEFTVR